MATAQQVASELRKIVGSLPPNTPGRGQLAAAAVDFEIQNAALITKPETGVGGRRGRRTTDASKSIAEPDTTAAPWTGPRRGRPPGKAAVTQTDKMFTYIANHPSISSSRLATALKMRPNHVGIATKRLMVQGRIYGSSDGWNVTDVAQPTQEPLAATG